MLLRGSLNRSANRSALVRQLSEGMGAGAMASAGPDFAERLGAWLSVADAITLRTALQAVPVSKLRKSGQPAAPQSLAEELRRVRATLAQSITTVQALPPTRGKADHSSYVAVAAAVVPLDPAAEFAMLHQRHGEQQRRMEMGIEALRAHAREVLTQASPELARLAALDAVMEQMLGGREQHLLSTVPAFLKKRFEQLRRDAAAESASETQPGTAPDLSQPTGWLAQLAVEFEQALLAELDLRLQPIAGMAEALEHAGH